MTRQKPGSRRTQWCWLFDGDEDDGDAHGPYATRAKALAAAKRQAAQVDVSEGRFVLGTCRYADPCDYAGMRVADMLELMDMRASDGEFDSSPSLIFRVPKVDNVAAQGALHKALRAWAKRYVTSNAWVICEKETFSADELRRKACPAAGRRPRG